MHSYGCGSIFFIKSTATSTTHWSCWVTGRPTSCSPSTGSWPRTYGNRTPKICCNFSRPATPYHLCRPMVPPYHLWLQQAYDIYWPASHISWLAPCIPIVPSPAISFLHRIHSNQLQCTCLWDVWRSTGTISSYRQHTNSSYATSHQWPNMSWMDPAILWATHYSMGYHVEYNAEHS